MGIPVRQRNDSKGWRLLHVFACQMLLHGSHVSAFDINTLLRGISVIDYCSHSFTCLSIRSFVSSFLPLCSSMWFPCMMINFLGLLVLSAGRYRILSLLSQWVATFQSSRAVWKHKQKTTLKALCVSVACYADSCPNSFKPFSWLVLCSMLPLTKASSVQSSSRKFIVEFSCILGHCLFLQTLVKSTCIRSTKKSG